MWGVENAECGKCIENFNLPFQMRRNSVLTIKEKEKNAMNHCILRCAGMVINVVVFTNAPVLLSLRTTRRVFKENGSIVNS